MNILAEYGYPTANRKSKEPEVLTDEQKNKIRELYIGTPDRGSISLGGTATKLLLARKTVRDYLESEGLLKPKGKKPKNQSSI